MQFGEENIKEVLKLLSGILHVGNIEFLTAGGAQVCSKTGNHTILHFLLSRLLFLSSLSFIYLITFAMLSDFQGYL